MPLTDFGYGEMFNSADSGLYLTQYRAYDPVASRWISRDPIDNLFVRLGTSFVDYDERSVLRNVSIDPTSATLPENNRTSRITDATSIAFSSPLTGTFSERITWPNEANLYTYANANPLSFTDPTGEGTPTFQLGGGWAIVSGRTIRFFGLDGRACLDIDSPGHHGAAEMHIWAGGVRGPATIIPVLPIN
jgi:hypothetical protein